MSEVVVDASAVVEFLRSTPAGRRVRQRIADHSVHIPHLCAIEVTNALRGLVRAGDVSPQRAEVALDDLVALAAERHQAEPFLHRIWELRANLTSYDGAYVTLAEVLDATLITVDRKLDTPEVRRLIAVEVLT